MKTNLIVQDKRGCREIGCGELPLRIGKRDDCGLVLDAPGVSRLHAVIFDDGGRLLVRDLGSANGTLHDGRLIQGDTPLPPGSLLEFGQARLLVSSSENAPPLPLVLARCGSGQTGIDQVKQRLHQELVAGARGEALDEANADDVERRVHALVATGCQGLELPLDRARLVDSVVAEALGHGPLEALLADPQVHEIMVNGPGSIYVRRMDGRLAKVDASFRDAVHLLAVIRRMAARAGREIHEHQPILDARLPDGSRMNAVLPPLAVYGPTVTIRKAPTVRPGLTDLVKLGALSPRLARLLIAQVRGRMSVCVSGGTGSGKTTMLAALAGVVPELERLVTVEDVHELALSDRHLVAFESRPAMGEGPAGTTLCQLVRNAVRMRPDRIIVGECRGAEALDLLQAMNTGHDGSMTTLHANSTREGLLRLETLVLQADGGLALDAIRRQIGLGIDLWIHLDRDADGARRVAEVSKIGHDGTDLVCDVIYRRAREESGESRGL